MADDDSRTDLPSSVPDALLPWQKKPRFSWTPQFEETFFQSLCQSVHMGLRENMSFKAEAWNRALAALRDQGAFPTKAHLINKTDNARKKFRLWRGLVENPQFSYDDTTRTISGSEEAWNDHLDKEPLARAFRDRAFDNTQYLEVLFPDVVGSGGQPKRVTKPRRKGPDSIPGAGGEATPPGASIMHMPNGPGQGAGPAGNTGNTNAAGSVANTPMRLGSNNGLSAQQSMNSTPIPIPSSTTNTPHHNPHTALHQQQRQAPNAGMRGVAGGSSAGSTIQPPLPLSMRGSGLMGVGAGGRVGSNAGGPGNALTPPDEISQVNNAGGATSGNMSANNGTGQKRYTPGDGTSAAAAAASSKRRRTDGSMSAAGANNNAAARNRPNPQQMAANAASVAGGAGAGQVRQATDPGRQTSISTPTSGVVAAGSIGTGVVGTTGTATATRGDGIVTLLSDVLSKYAAAAAAASVTRWPEQAMDIFFQEFADEDMDLQVRIAEKILTDTSKAVMFCKMPSVLRRHWVKRLRDASTRQSN